MDTRKVCIRKYLSENGKSPLNVSSNAHAQTPRPNHKGVEESHLAAALIPLLLDCGRVDAPHGPGAIPFLQDGPNLFI